MSKHRSPNYPAIGLRDAVEAVRAIYDKEKRTSVSGDVIAGNLGYSSLSGNARTKISALKKFALLEGDERKGMRVSDLAVRILYPSGAKDQIASLREAALTPELFQMLYGEFRDGSDEAIRHHLINRLAFAPQGANQLIAAYRDTYAYAGLNVQEYNISQASDKSEAESMNIQTATAPIPQSQAGVIPSLSASVLPTANAWTWTLSMPRNVKAELRIAGEATKSDIARLKKQIEFLEESFDDEDEA
jgi:hypothetical protein